MEERGFTGARLASKERVLPGAFADGEVLQLRCAGAADSDLEFVGGLAEPVFLGLRRDLLEGHFHTVGVDARLADLVNQSHREILNRRCIEYKLRAGLRLDLVDDELVLDLLDADAVLAEFVGHESVRDGLPLVPVDQREDAAAWAADGDALQACSSRVTEARGEVGDDEEVILLRHAASLLVVFRDRRILVAQIHLDDLFNVLVHLREPLFDLVALRPDAAVDEAFLIIGDVHEAGEVLTKPDRINDGERDLAGRRGGQQAEDDVVEGVDLRRAAGLVRFKQQRALLRESEREREGQLCRTGQSQTRVLRQAIGVAGEIQIQVCKLGRGFEMRRRFPAIDQLGTPFRELRQERCIEHIH